MDDSKYYSDDTEPNRIIKFFKTYLKHSKGTHAGKPFVLLPWQEEIIYSLFGTFKKEDNLRRYRQGLILLPRKNGKTTLIAGLCIYELLFGESNGELFACANNREQARIIFNITAEMVASSKELSKRIKVYKSALYNPRTKSLFKVLSRDATSALGYNASFCIMDELLGAPDDNLYNAMSTSMGARKQPMMLSISTAGFNKASFLYQLVEHGERVNHGIIEDDTFYSKMYGMKEGEDWTKEETWMKCNPSLGSTISIDFFRTEYNRAKEFARFENSFKTLYLNCWLDHEKGWLPDSQWVACGDDNLKIEDFKNCACFAGLDLSSTTDLTSLSLCFYKDEKYTIFTYPFCPSENIQMRSKRDKVPYELWRDKGYLTATDGNATDYQFIINKLQTLSSDYNITGIAVDRWNSSFLTTKLMELGFNVIAFGQGFQSMSSPIKLMERLVLNKQLLHDNHPVLRWCISNVILKIDPAGNCKADKAKSRDRIDCVISALMALEECSKTNHEGGIVEVSWI
jgi:phage terminase large subunit-like protein